MTARVHWHILGAGAMGCLWATALRDAGHAVTLILALIKRGKSEPRGTPLRRAG